MILDQESFDTYDLQIDVTHHLFKYNIILYILNKLYTLMNEWNH